VTRNWEFRGQCTQLARRITRANTCKVTQQQAVQQAVGTSSAAQLAYAYDLGDRITQITYPSGRIVQYGRDAKGRVNLVQTKSAASVGTWTVLAGSIAYEPFGSVKAIRFDLQLGQSTPAASK